jgi:hypothetical protein
VESAEGGGGDEAAALAGDGPDGSGGRGASGGGGEEEYRPTEAEQAAASSLEGDWQAAAEQLRSVLAQAVAAREQAAGGWQFVAQEAAQSREELEELKIAVTVRDSRARPPA